MRLFKDSLVRQCAELDNSFQICRVFTLTRLFNVSLEVVFFDWDVAVSQSCQGLSRTASSLFDINLNLKLHFNFALTFDIIVLRASLGFNLSFG